MRKLVFFLILFPCVTNAIVVGEDNYGKSGPDTECPEGFQMVDVPDMIIETTGCSAGTTLVDDNVESCLVSSELGECYMFVPEGKKYVDESGTYGFTNLCAME